MDLFKYLDLGKDLLSESSKSLKDISSLNVLNKSLEKNAETESGDFKFAFEAGASAKIDVYNDINDDDKDQLVSGLHLDNYITQGKAFLRYEMSGRVKDGTSVGLQAIEAGFSIDKTITLSSYLIHENSEALGEAVLADTQSLAMLFDKNKLADMEVGSVVTETIVSNAEFEGEAEWADTITSGISKASELLGSGAGVALELSAGAKIAFACTVGGNYQVIVQKQGADKFFVDIRKKKSSSNNVSGSVGVSAQIADTEDLEKLVDQLFNKVEQGLSEKLKPLLAKAENLLTANEREVILQGASVLGLETENIGDIKEKYDEKRKQIKDQLIHLLSQKVALGVALEYSKVKTRESLFSASFSKEEVLQYHSEIFTLKIAKLVDLKKGADDTTYRQITTLSIKKSLGIGISIGKWKAERKSEKTLDLSTEKTLEGDDTRFKVSHLAIGKAHRVSSGKEGAKNEKTHAIVLTAKMPSSVNSESSATIGHFDFQLDLTSSYTFKKIDRLEVHQMIDLAVLLDLITPDQVGEVYDLWKSRIFDDHRKISYESTVTVPFQLLDEMFDELAEAPDHEIASAMSASLPYIEFTGRSHYNVRKNVYQPFFNTFLNGKSSDSFESWEKKLSAYLHEKGYNDLAEFEGKQTDGTYWGDQGWYSFLNTFQYSGFKNNVHWLKKAFNRLHSKPGSLYSKELVKGGKVKKLINRLNIKHPYTSRFLYRFVLDMAQKAGVRHELETSLKITYTDKEGQEMTAVMV